MKGYFTRLAKLSSIATGAANSSAQARPGAFPRMPADLAAAPPHVESVVLVDSYASDREPASQSRSVEKTGAEDAGLEALRSTRTDNESANESRRHIREAPSNVPQPSIASLGDEASKPISKRFETNDIRQDSTVSFVVEKTGESKPDAISVGQVFEKSLTGVPGVVRIAQPVGLSEPRLTAETDSLTAQPVATSRPESSIPRDYIDALGEWLGSPTNTSERLDAQVVADRNPATVSIAADPAGTPLHADVVYRDSPQQRDIQEFSLSIGSISIVVEEPAQQPNQQSNITQPAPRSPAGAQPRATDAFALSRNYFRGF
jgi:hypothetical protein